MKKPRLLYVAAASSIHTVRWINAFAERNFDVHLATTHEAKDKVHPSVSIHKLPFAPPFGYFTNAIPLRCLWRSLQPDLVHAHFASGYGTTAALARIHPLLISVWGSDVYDFPERTVFHRTLLKHNLRVADRVLSTSKCMAQRTRTIWECDIDVTPFGIDTERFRPATGEVPEREIVVGCVKTLEPKYGIDYLLRAFRIVKDRFPNRDLKLLIVGGGPSERSLRQLCAELNLTDCTTFTGWVSHTEVPRFIAALDIVVTVSLSESFGVAVLEASACGKPVVVSNVGGLPEVAEHNVSGMIVPPKDAPQTADAISALISDPALRARLGSTGRQRVLRLFEWHRCVDRMESIYRSMLPARSSALPPPIQVFEACNEPATDEECVL